MLKRNLFVVLLCICASVVSAQNADYRVVPLPHSIVPGRGASFTLSASTPIVYEGQDADMQRQARFLSDYIAEVSGIKTNVVSAKPKRTPAIVLLTDNKIEGDEAYKITVTNKQLTIAGRTSAGVFYGMQTLRKALPTEDIESGVVYFPPVVVTDAPRFTYRGMMLDCARHIFPIDFVKRYIDLIALHNMNVFHWHLTDDQGWRIEVKKYPKLTEIGSKRSRTILGHNSTVDDGQPYGGYYTQEQAKEIVEYARQRHITVIPEIDMPGHMKAALASYPELGCTGGPYEVGYFWGVYRDVLCLGNEKVYTFVEDVIDEMTKIFPAKYFHIGGDETPTNRWAECPKCQKVAKENNLEIKNMQAHFTRHIEKYFKTKNRTIIGWDEILDGEIDTSTTIMSWRGVKPGMQGAERGHNVIMTPVDFCYLDYKQNEDEDTEPEGQHQYLPVSKVYSMNPAPADVPEQMRNRILGAQGNLWTEYIAWPNRAEYAVLPRMAALCEGQWMEDEAKNFDDFKLRVTKLAKLYDKYGYHYAFHIWPERFEQERKFW
jgi:hexosaminidase